MPISAHNHDRDGIAVDALRAVFPKRWLYKSTGEMYSNKEYCEDLKIEIVDKDKRPTEIEFGVQNKTDVEIRKNHVSVSMSTACVKRLLRLPRPVLIHACVLNDAKDDWKQSYWVWLHEWHSEHPEDTWQHQSEVAIQIPKKRILNNASVVKIEATAAWEQKKRLAEKLRDFANIAYATDYEVQVRSKPNHLITVIDAKNERSIPVIRPLDDVAEEAVRRVLQTGESVITTGRFSVENIPDSLGIASVFSSESEYVQTQLVPNVPDKTELTEIKLFDENNVAILNEYVTLRLDQQGTEIEVWKGKGKIHNIVYTISEFPIIQSFAILVQVQRNGNSARAFHEHFHLKDMARQARKIRITYLENQAKSPKEKHLLFSQEVTQIEQALRTLVYALVGIEDRLGVTIPIPEEVDMSTLQTAEILNRIFSEALAPLDSSNFVPLGTNLVLTIPRNEAKRMLESHEAGEEINIAIENHTERIIISFLSQELDLGEAQHLYKNCRICNPAELSDYLANDNIEDDARVTTQLEIDREQAFCYFPHFAT